MANVRRFLLKYSKLELALLALIVIASALRFVYAFQNNPLDNLFSDPGRHWYHATHLLEPTPLSAIDPIGYQLWLGAVAKVTRQDWTAIAIYTGLLSALTPWFWYRFSRQALASRRSALLCWTLLAWMPSWFGIYAYFMNETLLLPLLGASLWASWRAFRKQTFASLSVCAALWTLTCLTRVIALPLALLCITAVIWYSQGKWKRIVLVTFIFAALCFYPAFRAQQIIGVPTPFGYPVMNQIFWATGAWEIKFDLQRKQPFQRFVYVWGAPSIDEQPLAPLSDWKLSRQGSVDVFIALEPGARDWLYLLERFTPEPGRFAELARDNVVVALFGHSWPEIAITERRWEAAQYYLRFLIPPLLFFVVLGNIRSYSRLRDLDLLPMATLFAWFCLLVLPSAPMNGRFRKPLEGLLVVNAIWLFAPRRLQKEEAGTKPASV